MLLVIDVGNTRTKVFVYEQDAIVFNTAFNAEFFFEEILKIFQNYSKITHTVLSSVGKLEDQIVQFLEEHSILTVINSEISLPFDNLYATPKTLGVDRMVLAAGAVLKYPKQNRLVIDAGTCITYDFITADDTYLGGGISPGLRLRYESLHAYTAKLPLLNYKEPDGLIGNSTPEAIHSGVVNGFVNEITGFITEYEKQFVNLAIILTGGDAEMLSKKIKNTIFANPNFLIESLKQLHEYISIRK